MVQAWPNGQPPNVINMILSWTKNHKMSNTIVKSPIYTKLVTKDYKNWVTKCRECRNPLPGPTWCVLGLSLSFTRADASFGVKRQVVTCFWRLTLVCDVFLAFYSRMQHGTDVECQFASSKLKQSTNYYILLESSGCVLSNAIKIAPFGVL